MKNDINTVLNKFIAYARDNLMLDALDETYTLNRLAALCGTTAKPTDAECAETLDALFAQLAAFAPDVDKSDVIDIILPLPHTVNGYFRDELDRKPKKAFDFLFELYALGGTVSQETGGDVDGFVRYTAKALPDSPAVSLPVGDAELDYAPRVVKNHIAKIYGDDVLADDITARLVAFAATYGGVIAKRASTADYLCGDVFALDAAKIKEQLADGSVKLALVDYPVPALKVYGIAKNSVAREAARIMKAAADAGLDFTAACSAKDGVALYIVFAKPLPETDGFAAFDALAACGVFATTDYAPLMSVLEKGTALPNDLAEYKSVYAAIGGVKHGAKASAVLDAHLASLFKTALKASASADEQTVKSLLEEKSE